MSKQVYGSIESAINAKPNPPKKRILCEDVWLVRWIIKTIRALKNDRIC